MTPGSQVEAGAALQRVVTALRAAGLLAAPVPDSVAPIHLAMDSRAVRPGSLFLAVPGTVADGHEFIADAVSRGATLVMAGREVPAGVPVLLVRDPHRAARVAAAAWFDHPAGRLRVVGVTGTNGKTTSTALVRHLLNADGHAGSIGTLGAFDGAGERVPSVAGALTTPGPVDLHETLAALRDRGVRWVAMEASSHSLDQERLDGLRFAGAVFTNLTREHLDYHLTMEAYGAAKRRLLDLLAEGAPWAVNADDPAWAMLPEHPGRISFGLSPGADVRAEGLVSSAAGTRFRLTGRFGSAEVSLPLPGTFNVSNALGAAACVLGLGEPVAEVCARLNDAPQVPGRMERLASKPGAILRDYAHTPDAFERVLTTLRPLTEGRLFVLFGCGGDRDRGKRPEMGRVAAQLADQVVVTSDNPRTEDPERILDDIVGGMPSNVWRRFTDRQDAITWAVKQLEPGDTLLLAGKGHETYQIIGTEKQPFDERAIVRSLGAE